jgi:hypothetical protein
MAFPRLTLLRSAIVLAAALASLSAAGADANAATRSFRAASARPGALVFRVHGLHGPSVRAAYVRAAGARQRVSVRRVRAGARRGVIRVRPSRRVRRRLARRPTLVVRVTRDPRRPPPPPRTRRPVTVPPPVTVPRATPPSPDPVPPPHAPQVPAGALYVSPSGSDSNPGTRALPWRTLDKADGSARPGDVIVVRPGTYGARGSVTRLGRGGTASAPVTYLAEPGASRPRVLGQLRVTADHLELSGLLFDGPTGPVPDGTASSHGGEDVQVWIMGDDVELAHSEIRGNRWHAGVYLYRADDVRIVANYIHDNGQFGVPEHANLDHGIYWDSGSGLIANNLIERNYAYGIQLYPEVRAVRVVQNTIVRNGRGGVIVAERATDNLIVNNVIAYNERHGVRDWALTGVGNTARRNLLWSNGAEEFSGSAVAREDNLVADPRFVGPADYRLGPGSAGIGRALGDYSMDDDYAGRARSRAGSPDLGAYETG